MNIFVPYVGPSTNAAYSGQHWTNRVKHKRNAVMAVLVALPLNYKKFANPVRVEVTPQLEKGKKFYDVSNYSYTYKLIEDALVSRGVLQNDTSAFVTQVCFMSPVRGDRTGITILITEI